MKNTCVVDGDVARIVLSSEHDVLIDASDVEKASALHWRIERDVKGKFCARTKVGKVTVDMHRYLTDAPKGTVVRHLNGNKLDCRRANLHVSTYAEVAATRNNKVGESGVEHVTIARRSDGREYYFLCVARNGIKKRKNFPKTTEGLRAAQELAGIWERDITYEPERAAATRKKRDMSYVAPEPSEREIITRQPIDLNSDEWRIVGDAAYYMLDRGVEVIVSVQDLERVKDHFWFAMPNSNGSYYARGGDTGGASMSRFIMDAPDDMQVDHINHDTLDNRRENLRVITHQKNQMHRNGAFANSKTGIRGLSVHKCKPSGFMYVYRCHCQPCKVAKYFEYSEAGLVEAKLFAGEHDKIRKQFINS